MKIYVCGNVLVPEDSIPIKLINVLRTNFSNIEFLEYEPSDNVPQRDMIIIDTVTNLKEVQLIEDIDVFETTRRCSLHDFDLGWNMKIQKKFGLIDSVKIIGIPPKIDKQGFVDLKKIIANLSSENA